MLATRWTLLTLVAVACGAGGELDPQPDALDWGEIDFAQDMPDGGYAEDELGLFNTGEGDLAVTLTDFDFDHLCVVGWRSGQLPAEFPVIESEQT